MAIVYRFKCYYLNFQNFLMSKNEIVEKCKAKNMSIVSLPSENHAKIMGEILF